MRPGVFWGVLGYPWVSWGVLGYPGVSWGNQTDPSNAGAGAGYTFYPLCTTMILKVLRRVKIPKSSFRSFSVA